MTSQRPALVTVTSTPDGHGVAGLSASFPGMEALDVRGIDLMAPGGAEALGRRLLGRAQAQVLTMRVGDHVFTINALEQ